MPLYRKYELSRRGILILYVSFIFNFTTSPPPRSDITSHFLLTDTGVYPLRAFPIEPTPRCIWTSLSLPLLQSNIKPTKPSMSPSPALMAALFPSLSPGSPGDIPRKFKADVRRQIPRISFSYTGPPPIDKRGSHSGTHGVWITSTAVVFLAYCPSLGFYI